MTTTMNSLRLPRLLYLGAVPVESSYHGSALLYRLLENYPPARLTIVEAAEHRSQPERRLPAVAYRALPSGGSRLQTTRLHAWWSLWQTVRSASWAGRVDSVLDGFQPDAVLTVVHGHWWVAAAAFAKRKRLPLHLIVHDDWPRIVTLPRPWAGLVERKFGPIYRAAASRLCVSPAMVAEYRHRYRVDGTVLYPSRSRDPLSDHEPADRVRYNHPGLTVAFAGSLNVPDYLRILRVVARALRPAGGRVLVFGPTSTEQAAEGGLREPNVQFCGLLASPELISRLRATADVLLVPMSFASGDASAVTLSFPSKLTDYTAIGLPLLVTGPANSSAVRWARENPGVAEVVDLPDTQRMAAALTRLAADPAYRLQLATRAMEVGERMFSHQTAWDAFTAALTARVSIPVTDH